jgi:hypothetical protein
LIPLDALREDRRPGEPTAREVFGMLRRLRDGEPYDEVMAGFTDYDWGSPGSPRRRPRSLSAEPEPRRWVGTEQLERHFAHDPEMVNRVRARLVAEGQRYMDTHGYTSAGISWEMTQPSDPMGIYLMRLEVELYPRTDGEWPAIRAAIAEDEADRAEAARDATAVNDRLDALKAAADLWRSPSLTDACRSAGVAVGGFSEALARFGRESAGATTALHLRNARFGSTGDSPVA